MTENILASRYATTKIKKIFGDRNKVLFYRNLWISVMKAQKTLGMNIPSEDIEKFEMSKKDIDFNQIKILEKERRHDIKANIEAFVKVAGAGEYLHMGMTSRDLTDNVEQMQIKNASKIIFDKNVAVLKNFLDKSIKYESIVISGKTHHQPAQPTLLGRRFSMWAEELMIYLNGFENFIENYPLRGIKGPVGTQSDMLSLLGSSEKVEKLEKIVSEELGFKKVLTSTGQVYPRSLDFSLISQLLLLSSAHGNFAKTMRLMAGSELVTEGFAKNQTGSTAMPHKMNTRSSERVGSFVNILKGYVNMIAGNLGDTWEEGDVSCSATRRVAIPDSFYTSDGLCETTLTILNEMGPYTPIIDKEIDRYLSFLATTQILALGIEKDMGREEAHKIIRNYAIKAAKNMRTGGENNFIEEISKDNLFLEKGITKNELKNILDDREKFIGNAREQIFKVISYSDEIMRKYRNASKYKPKGIL